MIGLRGVTIGHLAPYVLEAVSGLAGPPGVRTDDVDRDGADGVHVGGDLYGPRTIELTVAIVAGSDAEVGVLVASFGAAFRRADRRDAPTLTWQLPGQQPRRAQVYPGRRAETDMALWRAGTVRTVQQLVAPDPRMYAAVETAEAWTIADGGTQAQRTFDVAGNYGTRPTVEIVGPCRNPRITFDDARALRVDIDVPVGSTLSVDTAAKQVTLDGAPRFDTVRADNQWPELAPGPNTLVYSRSAAALTGASSGVTVTHRAAWIA